MNKIFYTLLIVTVSINAFGQKADGSTKSLVNAEKAFVEEVAKNGTNAAFLKFLADDGLVFRPNPVNGKKYYATAPDTKNLSWTPTFVRVSRSGDLGFSTGHYLLNGNPKSYGHFLTVWRAKDGVWQAILDLSTETNKPLKTVASNFVEPKDHYTPKFLKDKELKANKEIINTTERTLNATLKSYGASAFAGFLNKDAQLMFPGTELIVGKENIQAFNNRMIDKINLKTVGFDKALGADIAYTYGVATIDYKSTELRESFHYVFLWERQADGNWNIMSQIFTLAER